MENVNESSQMTHDVTMCFICLNEIQEPKVPSCPHKICVQCLNDYCANSTTLTRDGTADSLECPLCDRIFMMDITMYSADNFFIKRLLEVEKYFQLPSLKNTTSCELCSVRSSENKITSTSYCFECEQRICDECCEIHTKIGSFQSHRVLREKDIVIERERLGLIESYCDVHEDQWNMPKKKNLYCYDCKMIMCRLCAGPSNNHCRPTVFSSKNKLRVQLEEDAIKLSEYLLRKNCDVSRIETDERSFMKDVDSTEREIERKYEQIIALVQAHKSQLLTELHDVKDKFLKETTMKKDEIKREITRGKCFQSYSREMKKKGTACDLARTAQDLRAKTKELMKTHEKRYDHKLKAVEFKPSHSASDVDNNFLGKLGYKEMTSITKFLDNPTLLRVIEPDHSQPITGLTVLGSELFIVRKSSRVFVYGCDSCSLIREIKITGSKELRGLVSCSYFNCLYVCDPGLTTIYRYDAAAGTSKDFATVSSFALSVTKTNHNVLATLRRPRHILEYTTHGQLLRKIDLDHSMDQPYHCIQLYTGNFIVSHEGTKHHRVRIVDKNGLLVQSYGESNGNSEGQLCRPRQIAVDKYDNIVVADFTNNRVQLLSSTLSYLGDVIVPGKQLEQPYSIHVDELNHRLYIGECGLGRVFVLDIRTNVGNRIEADELSTTKLNKVSAENN